MVVSIPTPEPVAFVTPDNVPAIRLSTSAKLKKPVPPTPKAR